MEARVVSFQGILRQPWCGNVDIGLQSPKCDLQEALIHVLCQVEMFAFRMLLCVCIRVFIQFAHVIYLIEDNGCNARDCAHPHGVCVRLYMCVCCKVFLAFYFACQQSYAKSVTVSNWARQLQGVYMYVIAISLVVD